MFVLSQKPKMAAQIYKSLMRFSVQENGQQDAMRVLMLLSGIIVEMSLIFDKAPDEAACSVLEKLAVDLNTAPNVGKIGYKALPPSAIIDQEIEKGRAIARELFEDWDDCTFEFYDFFIQLTHDIFMTWEQEGFRRGDMLRLLSECVYRGLAYEIAAQELCDLVIDKKARLFQWDLNSCIAALSALAGHKLAWSDSILLHYGLRAAIDDLDQIMYTMTQEAVRLGVPAGSNWRFGLAANDVPLNAPYELINTLGPVCDNFFDAIQLHGAEDQAVACAKAAGRMLAITAGGDLPEIEPAIAKPLAVSAMSDTYKTICMDKMHRA